MERQRRTACRTGRGKARDGTKHAGDASQGPPGAPLRLHGVAFRFRREALPVAARLSSPAPSPRFRARPVSRWHRFLAATCRHGYFSRLRCVGAQPAPNDGRGRLIVSSHRNGAIDGYVLLQAYPDAQFLTSVQLLRNPFVRIMFAGIPVLRHKDRQRYRIAPGAADDPLALAADHVRAGGTLVVLPEGSSEWGFRPLPYKRGAAQLLHTLMAEGRVPEVQAVGLFYEAPDRYRSRVELMLAQPMAAPARTATVDELHELLGIALDAVSVVCDDAGAFDQAETAARRAVADVPSASYAQAFLHAVGEPEAEAHDHTAPPVQMTRTRPHPWQWPALAAFAVLGFPLLAVARWAGGKADAINTVSFFRIAGAVAIALLWCPMLLAASIAWPWLLVIVAFAVWGAACWPALKPEIQR